MLLLNDIPTIVEADIALTWSVDGSFNNAPPSVSGKPWKVSYVPSTVPMPLAFSSGERKAKSVAVQIEGTTWVRPNNDSVHNVINYIHVPFLQGRGNYAYQWDSPLGVQLARCRKLMCSIFLKRFVFTFLNNTTLVFFESETDAILMTDFSIGWHEGERSRSATDKIIQLSRFNDRIMEYFLVNDD